jgi:hypothetical protein
MAKRASSIKIKSLVKNYGLMWRRDSVFWGRGRDKGVLNGRLSGKTIDFRDQIGVYVLYDESRLPVYIGQAGQGNARLFNRLRTHRRDALAHRWHYFSWFGLLSINKSGRLSNWDAPHKRVSGTIRSTLNEVEGVLIAATEPAFNKQGAKFRGIARYRQVPHAGADYTPPTQLRDLLEEIRGKIEVLSARVAKAENRR